MSVGAKLADDIIGDSEGAAIIFVSASEEGGGAEREEEEEEKNMEKRRPTDKKRISIKTHAVTTRVRGKPLRKGFTGTISDSCFAMERSLCSLLKREGCLARESLRDDFLVASPTPWSQLLPLGDALFVLR